MDVLERSLRQEMLLYNEQLHRTTLFILGLMLVCAVLGRSEQFALANAFITVLGVGWVFAMARYDYLIHRIGEFLHRRNSDWETSDLRHRNKWFLVITDIGAMVPIIVLFVYGCWQTHKLGYERFGLAMIILFLLGLAGIPLAVAVVREKYR